MKLLQSVFLVTIFTVISSVSLFSQSRQNRSPEEMAKQQTEWMTKELTLDEGQVEKVSVINLKYSKDLQKTWQQNQGNREAMRSAMTKLTEEKDKELKKVLTEDQFKLYQKKVAERRAQMRSQRGGGKGGRK